MWYIIIVAGWLACSVASYLLMRWMDRCGGGRYTTGDRSLNLALSLLLGPAIMLVLAAVGIGIVLLIESDDEAGW